MNKQSRQRAIDLYDRFTHDGMERRAFMAEMAKLAGSLAAAELLIAGIAANAAAAPLIAEHDPRIWAGPTVLDLGGGLRYQAYVATPMKRGTRASVLVIHENRGLNDHIRDVARRVAVAGYEAVAPDMLSPTGGTPADENAARDAIGKLDLGKSVTDAVSMLGTMSQGAGRNGKVGTVGFCWGGGFVDRLAIAAGDKLDAAVAYYGPAPDPSEATKVHAPMLLHFAGLDQRVTPGGLKWAEALRSAGKTVSDYVYPGVNHGFNNDTSAERYDKAAADLAWSRTLAFFKRYLG